MPSDDLRSWGYYSVVLIGLRLVVVAAPALAVAAAIAGGTAFGVLAGAAGVAALVGMGLAFPLLPRVGRMFRDGRPVAGIGAIVVRDLLTGRQR